MLYTAIIFTYRSPWITQSSRSSIFWHHLSLTRSHQRALRLLVLAGIISRLHQALSSEYFRVPPPRSPNPVYPLKWCTFPGERARRSPIPPPPGKHPNWVAAIAGGGGGGGSRKGSGTLVGPTNQGWWESCYVVDVPPPDDGRGGDEERAVDKEWVEVESFLRRSLPGARLHRLSRLQDRGRWLRFACARDIAVSTATATADGVFSASVSSGGAETTTGAGAGAASVTCLFANPREVVTHEVLSAFATRSGTATGSVENGMGEGRRSSFTGNSNSPWRGEMLEELGVDRAGGVNGASGTIEGHLRCSASARYATVAFASPPPSSPSPPESATDNSATESRTVGLPNLRTLAVVRAVTGVVVSADNRDDHTASTMATAVTAGEAAMAGGEAMKKSPRSNTANDSNDDPFAGVDPSIDDLTRLGGIRLHSSLSAQGGDCFGTSGDELAAMNTGRLPPLAPGLGHTGADSVKMWESLNCGDAGVDAPEEAIPGVGNQAGWAHLTRGQGGGAPASWGDGVAEVFIVRRGACYPEYLIEFSFPPHCT